MSLKTTYKEYILEQLLLKYLYDGIVPTADQLEDDLETYQESHPNLELPLSRFKDFSVEHGGKASASKIKDITKTLSSDVAVVVKEIYRLAQQSSKYYERWSNEIKRLEAKARKLDQRVNSLLLLTNNTAGYFAAVGDVFSDMNLVDTENTTAIVNLNESSVVLNNGHESLEGVNQIDLTPMTQDDVVFRVLSKRSGTAYYPPSDRNDLVNIFKTSNTTWVGKVSSRLPGEMNIEIKAHVSTSDIDVSKVSLEWTGPNSTTRSTVTLMYSDNGYFWNLVPTTNATRTITPNMVWTFPLTKLRWIKFIIRKPSHDEGSYDYVYSARNVKLYGNTFSQELGNVFVSKALSTTNNEGAVATFSLAQLDVCETVPNNTNIKYYLSASKDNSSWTSWLQVLPSDRNSIAYPKVINFGGVDWKNNGDSSISKLNTSYDLQKIITTFNATGVSGYRFKNSSFGAINTMIKVTTGSDPDPIANSIVLWRNIKYRDTSSSSNYPDTLTVRGVPRGWSFDGQVYTCYFEIKDSQGKIFNFGPNPCIVDDQMVSGVVTIAKGIHKFSTASKNWVDISSNLSSWPVSSSDVFSTLDPLYPYNHKLIIEGVPYPSSFIGDKVYLGADLSAEFYAKRISLFDLENTTDEYGVFAIRGVGDDSANTAIAVIVRYDNINTDYTNELLYLRWRSGDQSSSSSQELYKYIKLKAELETSDSGISPEFESYRIKLGI